jgi:hypothetical protein
MVFNLIIVLAVSIVGMLALISVKSYELSTGKLLFAGARPRISRFSQRMVFIFGTALPRFVVWEARRVYRWLASFAHSAVARAALRLERWLESVLTTVREKTTTTRAPGEASAFLREVAEHKKKLTGRIEEKVQE